MVTEQLQNFWNHNKVHKLSISSVFHVKNKQFFSDLSIEVYTKKCTLSWIYDVISFFIYYNVHTTVLKFRINKKCNSTLNYCIIIYKFTLFIFIDKNKYY